MYTKVIKEECIACGLCSSFANMVFDYDEEGYAENILDNNTGTKQIEEVIIEDVTNAHEACPTEAIKISNAPFETT